MSNRIATPQSPLRTVQALLGQPELFEQWLLTWVDRDPDHIVGYHGNGSDCPIARWLRSMTGQEVQIGRNSFAVSNSRRLIWPGWARRYVRQVDSRGEGGDKYLTATQALYNYRLATAPSPGWLRFGNRG